MRRPIALDVLMWCACAIALAGCPAAPSVGGDGGLADAESGSDGPEPIEDARTGGEDGASGLPGDSGASDVGTGPDAMALRDAMVSDAMAPPDAMMASDGMPSPDVMTLPDAMPPAADAGANDMASAGDPDAMQPVDSDGDGVPDDDDNCPEFANADQADVDGDGIGDACAPVDSDGDGLFDHADNCPAVANRAQTDGDGDGVGDRCDNCPATVNPSQDDSDGDGIGDICANLDTDGDGVPDGRDNCRERPNAEQLDGDGDGIGDPCDNCPGLASPDPTDVDGDGIGDVCDDFVAPVRFTLEWDVAPIVDYDLHLLHPRGAYDEPPLDCYWRNPEPAWGARLDGDSTGGIDGGTREQIGLLDAPPGLYTVAALVFRGAGRARMTVACGDGEPLTFGPVVLGERPGGGSRIWEVLRIDPQTCAAELIDAVRDADCGGGCVCPDCAGAVCGPALCPPDIGCDQETGVCEANACDGVECPAGEVCVDGRCAGRMISDWSDGPRQCGGADDCTADEQCRNLAFFDRYCTLPCAALPCPGGFACCDGVFAVPVCVADGHRWADDCR